MSDLSINKPPVWYWTIAGLALVWNLLGVMAYIQQVTMSADALAKLPEAEQLLYSATPAWVTGAFAIAVFGGAIGCALLLLRNKLARFILIVSLVGVLAQMSYVFFVSKAFEVYGPGSAVMPVIVLIFAVFLIWFAGLAERRRWLK